MLSLVGTLEIDADPALDFAVMYAREDVVDVLQRVRRDGRVNLSNHSLEHFRLAQHNLRFRRIRRGGTAPREWVRG